MANLPSAFAEMAAVSSPTPKSIPKARGGAAAARKETKVAKKAAQKLKKTTTVFGPLVVSESQEQGPNSGVQPSGVQSSPGSSVDNKPKKRLRVMNTEQEACKKFKDNFDASERSLLGVDEEKTIVGKIIDQVYDVRKGYARFDAQFYKSLKTTDLFHYSPGIFSGERYWFAKLSKGAYQERLVAFEEGYIQPDHAEINAMVAVCNGLGQQTPGERTQCTKVLWEHLIAYPQGVMAERISYGQLKMHLSLAVDKEICSRIRLGDHKTACSILNDENTNKTFKYVIETHGIPWSDFIRDLESPQPLTNVDPTKYVPIQFARQLFKDSLAVCDKLKAEEGFETKVLHFLSKLDTKEGITEDAVETFISKMIAEYKFLSNVVNLGFLTGEDATYMVNDVLNHLTVAKKIRHTVVLGLRFKLYPLLRHTNIDRIKDDIFDLPPTVPGGNNNMNAMNGDPLVLKGDGHTSVGPDGKERLLPLVEEAPPKSNALPTKLKISPDNLPRATIQSSTIFRTQVQNLMDSKTAFSSLAVVCQNILAVGHEDTYGECDVLLWSQKLKGLCRNFDVYILDRIQQYDGETSGIVQMFQKVSESWPLRLMDYGKHFADILQALRVTHGLTAYTEGKTPRLLDVNNKEPFACAFRNVVSRNRLGFASKKKLARAIEELSKDEPASADYDRNLEKYACFQHMLDPVSKTTLAKMITARKESVVGREKAAPKKVAKKTKSAAAANSDALRRFQADSDSESDDDAIGVAPLMDNGEDGSQLDLGVLDDQVPDAMGGDPMDI